MTLTQLESHVMQSEAAEKAGAGVARQRLQRHHVDESALRLEAESVILEFLPPLPRRAKRMFNRLRVLIVVAIGRQMLGGSPNLSPAHLGRWIVLNKRWPDLATAVTLEPPKLKALETVRTQRTLEQELKKLPGATQPSVDLLRFFRSSPRLSEVVTRLVYLDDTARVASK
jgi:hypothetical protein